MASQSQQGTKTVSALDTEETMGSAINAAGVYVLTVSLENLARTEYVILSAKVKIASADTAYYVFRRSFSWIHPEPNVQLPPVVMGAANEALQFYVEQSGGTAWAYDYRIDDLAS